MKEDCEELLDHVKNVVDRATHDDGHTDGRKDATVTPFQQETKKKYYKRKIPIFSINNLSYILPSQSNITGL